MLGSLRFFMFINEDVYSERIKDKITAIADVMSA